ncbi:MAG: SMC-Scp complex subunit ScpB [Alphaproteobacteria bacterium]|nr:SMC-Scp complex subunit ScpB [Alphaproteobacteria bacterium]
MKETSELSQDLRLLEAVIFASAEPVTKEVLVRQFGEGVDIDALLETLRQNYEGRGVNLVQTDGMWSFRSAPDISPFMKITRQPRRKLPRAAAEVLAIIAYHQPVTRADIENIRGVETSRGTLDILLELGWIRPGKRRETPGRPLTWRTTPEFLSYFNIETLNDLPGLEELKAAGLLDARPVIAGLPNEPDDDDLDEAAAGDDDDFAGWVDDADKDEA